MATDWPRILRYILSDEDSRTGRTDYWNFVFLPGKPLLNRVCLEQLKIWICLLMAIAAGSLLSRL
ncbi:MAG: hypothetical protein MI863_08610 [Desulfobacterales bacterium]|nr:hypothetical protein [Desulfobacterales bacterium]